MSHWMYTGIRRLQMAAFVAAAMSIAGCSTMGFEAPKSELVVPREMGVEVRPDAPAEYDILVGLQHESHGELAEATAAYQRALAKDADSPFIHRRIANSLVRQGNPTQALVHAQRAFELEPEDDLTRLFLGQLYRLSRQFAEAEAVLLDADGDPRGEQAAMLLYQINLERDSSKAIEIAQWLIERDENSTAAYGMLAKAHERMGNPQEAEKALRTALSIDPTNVRIFSQLARLAREQGDIDAQQAIFREVLENHPHHLATLMALADVQIGDNDSEGAIQTLKEIQQHYPDAWRVIERLGFVYYEAERFEDAAAQFERFLTSKPGNGEVTFFLGIVRRRLGDDEAAADAFKMVSTDSDHYAEARTQLAVLYERAGEFDRALEELQNALAVNPTRPRELYSATLRAKAGDFDGAVEYLEGLLLKSPDDDELLYNLGVVYGEAKRTKEALVYMQRAIERNPKNASALNYVGYTWAEGGEQLDLAEDYITQALGLRPDDGFITDSLGWVYYMRALPLIKTGREEEARKYIERSLETLHRAEELTGGDPVVSEHLGDAYLLLDEKEQALQNYEQAVELVPREGEQPDLMKKLEGLRRELE
jgi:tetratricopeptide (TPR) repeat protein